MIKSLPESRCDNSQRLNVVLISSIFGGSCRKIPSILPSIRKENPARSKRLLTGTSAWYSGSCFALCFWTRVWISIPSAAERPYPGCASMLPVRGAGTAKSRSGMVMSLFTISYGTIYDSVHSARRDFSVTFKWFLLFDCEQLIRPSHS